MKNRGTSFGCADRRLGNLVRRRPLVMKSAENYVDQLKASRREVKSDAVDLCCGADSGLGMSEEEIVVALTPFAQVDATRSRWRITRRR